METIKKILGYLILPFTILLLVLKSKKQDQRLSDLKQEDKTLANQQAKVDSQIQQTKSELSSELKKQEGLSHEQVEDFHSRFNSTR